MREELVGVIDINGYWSNILCISCSEGKQISSFDDFVAEVKLCQEYLADCEFVQRNDEVYVIVDEMTQVNPGEHCK